VNVKSLLADMDLRKLALGLQRPIFLWHCAWAFIKEVDPETPRPPTIGPNEEIKMRGPSVPP